MTKQNKIKSKTIYDIRYTICRFNIKSHIYAKLVYIKTFIIVKTLPRFFMTFVISLFFAAYFFCPP
jgi:hypothetical protein